MSQLRELESLVELSLVMGKAAGIGKNTVQFLTDFFSLGMVSGHQEQMSERLKIPTLSSHVEF